MNITELTTMALNPAIAYAIGLICPLYKEKTIDGKKYIIGSVNHNSGKVTQTELAEHFNSVYKLFEEYHLESKLTLRANKSDTLTLSPKEGFSILIDAENYTKEQCISLLNKRICQIKTADTEIQKFFIRACFDGRSSWDTTAHYLSIDINRDYTRQDLVIEIIERMGINLNNNRRALDHEKNDQIRIKPDSLQTFINTVGLFSTCRLHTLEQALRQI